MESTALRIAAASFRSVAIVAATSAVGVYAHRTGLLTGQAQKVLDRLVANLFLPCLIIRQVTPNIDLHELVIVWPLAVTCVITVLYGLFSGALLAKCLAPTFPDVFPRYRGLVMVALAFPNSFSVPLTLFESVSDHPVFEPDRASGGIEVLRSRIALQFVMSYVLWILARWSIGYPVLCGAISCSEWREKITNPPMIACSIAIVCGLLWNVLGQSLGAAEAVPAMLSPVAVALKYVGSCSIPSILLALGARLDQAVTDILKHRSSRRSKADAMKREAKAEPNPSELAGLVENTPPQLGDEPAGERAADDEVSPQRDAEKALELEASPTEASPEAAAPPVPVVVYLLVAVLRQVVGAFLGALFVCGVLRGLCGVNDRVVLLTAMLQTSGPPMIHLGIMAGLSGNAEMETSKLLLVTYAVSLLTSIASLTLYLALLA